MKCVYCNEYKQKELFVRDHFLPKSKFKQRVFMDIKYPIKTRKKLIKNNYINVCNICNLIKSGNVFWSIESVAEYIKYYKKTNKTYKSWLLEKFNDKNFVSLLLFLLKYISKCNNTLKWLKTKKRAGRSD